MSNEPETLTPQAMALGEALASVRAKAKADGLAYKVAEVRFMPFAHYPWWVEMACGDVKVYADWPPALSFALGVPVVARDEAAELREHLVGMLTSAVAESEEDGLIAFKMPASVWGKAAAVALKHESAAVLEALRRLAGGEEQE